MIRNPSEHARLTEELADAKLAFTKALPKGAKECMLRVIRGLEAQLGIEGNNYNGSIV